MHFSVLGQVVVGDAIHVVRGQGGQLGSQLFGFKKGLPKKLPITQALDFSAHFERPDWLAIIMVSIA